MTTDNEQPEQADEIYLTADEFEQWFGPGNSRPELLIVASSPLLLHDHFEPDSDPWNPSQPNKLSNMVRLAFGHPEPVPEPEPEVRKLTRGADAVWTLFRWGRRIIAVNDDGSAAVKIIPVTLVNEPDDFAACARNHLVEGFPPVSLDDFKMRIDPEGNLIMGDVEQSPEQLAMPGIKDSIRHLQSELKTWAKREPGRRVPLGISQLLKRINEALKIYPPMPLMTTAEVDAAIPILNGLR